VKRVLLTPGLYTTGSGSMTNLNPRFLPAISLHPRPDTRDILAVVDAGVMTTFEWDLEFTEHPSHAFWLVLLVVAHERFLYVQPAVEWRWCGTDTGGAFLHRLEAELAR
jgi:hypothetical protein